MSKLHRTLWFVGVVFLWAWTPPVNSQVYINEFMAANSSTMTDEDGDTSDWIEFLYEGVGSINMGGWHLTDDAANLRKWTFPAVELASGDFLLVFASGKDRAVAGLELHANFRMNSAGEYLALVRPDGETIEHEYAPAYPLQRTDISYGLSRDAAKLIDTGMQASYWVPTSDAVGLDWTTRSFVPGAGWQDGATGIGFFNNDVGGSLPEPVAHWNMDGNTDDQTGNGNHGSFVGGAPSYTEGFDGTSGGALSLNGTQYLDVTQAHGLPLYDNPAFTISMWVKGSGSQNDRRVFSEGSNSNNSPLFTLGTDNNGNSEAVDLFVRSDGGGSVANHVKSQAGAFDNDWHHITWVDQNGTADLYVDGVLDGTNFDYSKPDLSLNVTSIGAVLRGSACCQFVGALDEIALWDTALSPAEVAELAAGTPPSGGHPFGSQVDTNIEAQMLGANASVYVRVEFEVEDASRYDALTLLMKYDDGFIAYLNGQEVARRSAPGAATWDSAATGARDNDDAREFETISISDHVNVLQDGINVLAIHGLNVTSADDDFLMLPELVANSSSGFEERYFRTATPGAVNLGGFVNFVGDTVFNFDRGFYTDPIEVEIMTETPGADIYYTTNGSAPSLTSGTRYDGPILVDTTTTLRAIALRSGWEPTNVDTQTYIFLDDVIRQPNTAPPGYPSSWQGWPADYGMDPNICTNTNSPDYAPTIKDDLLSLPTLSIVMSIDALMGSTNGIYTHSLSRGSGWERPASVELIVPDGSEDGFQIDCGIRMQGGSSARPGEGKHAFRLLFKEQYGATKLRYKLFEDSPMDRFDTIVLRCFSTDSWHFKDGGSRYRRWDSQFIRDMWMKDSQLAMGHVSGHNRYVHLYVNGMYWGVYNPSERPDDDFLAYYYGDEAEDWDIVKDFNELFRGNRTSWNQLMNLSDAGLGSASAYQRIQGNNPDGTRNPAYPVLIDVDNLIDYMMLHFFAGAEDWPHHNWYGARSRTGNFGGWRFYVWDQEIVLDFAYRNRLGVSNDNSPSNVYAAMRANPEFRVRFGDRVQKHLFNGGALTVAAGQERWIERAAQIDRAVIAESARWGDYREDVADPSNSPAELYTRDRHWLVEQAKVLNTYIPESHRRLLDRLETFDLYPETVAPTFSQHGGLIEPGFSLRATAPAGTVYYTVDGSDPRLEGGGVSADALVAGEAAVETLVASGALARALVPADDSLGLSWTAVGFADGAWTAGTTGVGYERSSGYEDLIGTDMRTTMDGVNASVYIRVPFNLDDPGAIDNLTLRMKYDDGFVAYLNGVEVASANAPSPVAWNSEASAPHSDSLAIVFESFDISAFVGELVAGNNVLAIHGMNSSPSSSDMLILPELVSSVSTGGDGGIVLTGPTVVKARAFDGNWSALTEAFFYLDLPLRITELMFHPRDPEPGSVYEADDFEFVEMQNAGKEHLDLAGFRLEGGVEFEFEPDFPGLSPGSVIVVAKNVIAFLQRYPIQLNLTGVYAGRLSNAGDEIRLVGPLGEPVLSFRYSDRWYPETDGLGHSLTIVDPFADPDSWGLAESWEPSDVFDGTPGVVNLGDPNGGWQVPGDANQDGGMDISDVVRTLLLLFDNAPLPMPCGGATLAENGNMALLDVNGDSGLNVADPIYMLNYLFGGGPAPTLGPRCVRIAECPDVCR